MERIRNMPNSDQSENWKLRDHFNRRYSSMEDERTSFLPLWQDISDHVRPKSARINITQDNSKGRRADIRIVDPTATLASRTLRSGLMAGLTSPARPWFKLTTPDPDMAEHGAAKTWLYEVETVMRAVFTKSNFYQVLPMVYGDQGDFGTAAMSVLEDDKNVVRFNHFQIGAYLLAVNQYNRCDTIYRRFPMTVRNLVKRFGIENVSPTVKGMWAAQQYETEIDVCHCVEPNTDRDKFSVMAEHKPFRSVYFEWGADQGLFLDKSGFDEFPVMAPRWDLYDDSVYGTASPGIDSLGTIRALQLTDKRRMQAVDWHVRPHLIADESLRTQACNFVPDGGITFINGLAQQAHAGLRPVREIKPDLQGISAIKEELQQFIKRGYFEDMMQMLAQSDNPKMTAREIEERHSEKVLILGPVMERDNDEIFDPCIERVFGICHRKGMFPPPPEMLKGQNLKIEYTSILAQAQKLLGTANIEKVSQFTGMMAGMDPKALDKFDVDEAIDTYAEMHGINPNIIRTADQVKGLREARAAKEKATAMAQMAKPMKEAAQGAKALGETDGGNVQDLVRAMSGQ
jgi:hypothetical protein